ncbi:MAG TPA: DUF167 domain-containing protein [Bacteroidia bacterium]|jgi:uncharacterized protein (TIGR00251 family)|nr:DUF167 domain-containing protein [Bacteroidia bacterium]
MISIRIKVKPNSFKDEISLDAEGNMLVKIKEKPIDGAANEYLIKFLAKEFNISKNSIVLEKGMNGRFKKLSLFMEPQQWQSILTHYSK